MKVAIYSRVSSNKQELSQQIAACKKFCDYRGFEVGAIYSEIVSGAKAKRGKTPIGDLPKMCEDEDLS